MGEETINPMSMDPLAWHLALTLIRNPGRLYLL